LNENKSMINDMTTGRLFSKMVHFAWPILIANLLQTAYNMVDMIIVGRFVGSAGLSGVSNGGEILTMFMFICFGFTGAGQVMIGQFVGKKDTDGIRRTIGTMATFIIALALFFMAVGLLFGKPFLKLINTPADAYDYAVSYYLTCVFGIVFIFGYNLVSSVLRGMGDSTRPMIFVGIAAVLNTVLDLWFVTKLDMGTFGAALATVIGQAVSFIISVIYLINKKESFGFDFKLQSFKPDPRIIRLIMKMGLPMALEFAALSLSGIFVNSLINKYGVTISAVTSIGNRLAMVTNVITDAAMTATSSVIAQNIAADKKKRVSGAVLICLGIGFTAAALFSLFMLIMPREIFSIFNEDVEVLDMAGIYMPIAILNFFGYAARAPFMALMTGTGAARLSLICGIMDGIVLRVSLAMLLGIALGFGIMGLWYGSVIASYAPFVIGFVYYITGAWKKRKLFVG